MLFRTQQIGENQKAFQNQVCAGSPTDGFSRASSLRGSSGVQSLWKTVGLTLQAEHALRARAPTPGYLPGETKMCLVALCVIIVETWMQ